MRAANHPGRAMDHPTDAKLIEQLDSAEEAVRAAAAVELAKRGHPRALEASLRTLDDAPEMAHADTTPAVWSLAGMGLPALRALLDAMGAEAPMTRMHAGRAAMEITRRRFGYDGRAWPDGTYARWADFWRAIGFAYDAPPDRRAASIGRLRSACDEWSAVEPTPRPSGP